MPSTPREPLLEAAFARSPGEDVRRRIRAWAAVVADRLGVLGFLQDAGDLAAAADSRGARPEDPGPPSAPTRVVLARIEGRDGQRDVRHQRASAGASEGRGGDAWRGHIVLSIDEGHVEVAAELSISGVAAARARITDPVRALELTTTFESLPEQFALGIAGEEDRSVASHATTDELRSLFDRAEREQRPLWLGWSIPRDVAIAHAALLDEQLEDAVVALGVALAVLSPVHDGGPSPGMRTRPRRGKQRGGAVDDEGRGSKRRALAREDDAERADEARAEPERTDHDRVPRAPIRAAPPPPNGRGAARDRLGRRRAGSAPSAPLEKGERVRVLEGPFSGKVGTVQELDGKGGARVMLGLLAVRVDLRDLARCAEGRQRPMLSSSHRKPPLVRS